MCHQISCGRTTLHDAHVEKDGSLEKITRLSLTNRLHAIEKLIETRYCPSCPNMRGRTGRDLGVRYTQTEHRIALSHELINAFTSCFTTSKTPAYSFHQQIDINDYSNFRTVANVSQCLIYICQFTSHSIPSWNVFNAVQIPRCHRRRYFSGLWKARSGRLKTPTISDRSHLRVKLAKSKTKTVSFTGSVKLHTAIQKAIDASLIPFLGNSWKDMTPEVLFSAAR